MAAASRSSARAEVVIVGGGVAALEATIALHDLASDLIDVTLVAPGPDLVFRPLAVAEPFCLGSRTHHPLAAIASDFAATYVRGTVDAVDAARRVVHLGDGRELAYDSLIMAPGGRTVSAYEHAVTIGEDASVDALHGILSDLEQGYVKRIAFVVPSAVAWSLPLYELALFTAADARGMGIDDAELVVVSAEERPLGLFGVAAAEAIERLLEQRGIDFFGASAAEVGRGVLTITPGGRLIGVERTFALPLLRGPALAGLPCDAHGFIPADTHGRVRGLDGVFAAGDVTSFPLKQGGLAAQQAEAAAQAVAARHGCALDPAPFRPVLRGRLMTGDEDLFLSHGIAGGAGAGSVGHAPLWWPPVKIASRRLAPYLFGTAEAERMQRAGATPLHVG
jgi:sulfide:quinone oxidoreductase